MTYNKRNKLISLTISLVILLAISFLYCLYNLNRNAVYYSSHIPHSKGTNPNLVVVMNNLEHTKIPNNQQLRTEIDGNPSLIKNNYYILEQRSNHIILKDSQLFSNKGFIYYYSETGQYLYATNNKTWKKDYSNIRKQEAVQTVSKIIDPIIKAQPKPKINLQWLFDWKYKDRFQ
ncbi:hypothetical protein BOVMAS18_14820 [Streptococcus uberis]